MPEFWPLFLAVSLMSGWLAADVLIPWVARLAYRLGRVDQPDARKVHTVPIPRLGGIAIFLGFLVSVAMTEWLVPGSLFDFEGSIKGLLVGATLMFALGVADDLRPLNAKLKLSLQIVAAIVAFWLGVRVEFLSNPLGSGIWILPAAIALPLTVAWIVGVTNTINLIDGLDGLAAGVSLIAAATLGVIALQTNQPFSALLALSLAGATIGFLRYNFNPAKIFMGDGGAYFLGFTLAAISITGVLKLVAAVALVLPIIILGVPIFDTTFAIVRRVWNRRPIFSPDRGHLHHRLLDAGLSQRRTVIVIYGISLLLGGTALTLLNFQGGQTMIAAAALFLVWGAWSLFKGTRETKNKETP